MIYPKAGGAIFSVTNQAATSTTAATTSALIFGFVYEEVQIL